jgi:hypothetical protein
MHCNLLMQHSQNAATLCMLTPAVAALMLQRVLLVVSVLTLGRCWLVLIISACNHRNTMLESELKLTMAAARRAEAEHQKELATVSGWAQGSSSKGQGGMSACSTHEEHTCAHP